MDTFQTFLNACRNGQKKHREDSPRTGRHRSQPARCRGQHGAPLRLPRGIPRSGRAAAGKKGADASSANNRGETPLHAAARKGNREILARLLDAGADPDATDHDGCTPLMRLCGEPPHGCRSVADRPRSRHRGYGPDGTPRAGLRHGTPADGGGRAPHANRCGRRRGA